MTAPFNDLKARMAEIIDLRHAAGVLSWDQETYMPPGGVAARAEQLATVEKLAHEQFTSDAIGELLATLGTNHFAPDSDEACMIRVTRRDYEKARKLPADLVARLARESALAREVWIAARKESNFARFAPNLQTIVSLTIEAADLLRAEGESRYDALLDQYEPEMKTAEVRRLFETLKQETVPLIHEISERLEAVDDSCLYRDYDEAKQLALGEEAARLFGFDFRHGRQDKSVHPFCTSFSPADVRITTRVNHNNVAMALFGTMHETGHALYEQGLPPEHERTPLCRAASLGVHESQSRMWENLVGRSRAFWRFFFPRLQATFPAVTSDLDAEALYRAANKVRPSFIRVEADELTYNFHILLRYELETDLVDGRVSVTDLPEAWNAKMKEYLGIVPPDDAQGVLQDIHWSGGAIGYFPTYTLGNLIGAQLDEKIAADIPDLEAQFERGEFASLLAWLRENVHRHGRRYPPAELVRRVTGQAMSADAFVRYARRKFGELYGL